MARDRLRRRREEKAAETAAMLTALAMIAFQVSARAVRDTLFGAGFSIARDMPWMVIVSSTLSLLVIPPTSYLISSSGPRWFLPRVSLLSSLMLLLVWLTAHSDRPAAVFLYLHIATIPPVLISALWSLINERFDVRTSHKRISRVAATGAMGGVVGWILSDRVGTLSSPRNVLVVLSGLHLFCALTVRRIGPKGRPVDETSATIEETGWRAGVREASRDTYVRHLIWLILSLAIVAGLADYLFQVAAVSRFPVDADRNRFLALFYGSAAVLTFVLQFSLSTRFMERMGIRGTTGVLPAGTGLASLGLWGFPGLAGATLLKGVNETLRNSAFRSGFELLFKPIRRSRQRIVKTIVDVGGDRVGTILVFLFLYLLTRILGYDTNNVRHITLPVLLLLCSFGVALSTILQKEYVVELGRTLSEGDVPLDIDFADDASRQAVKQALDLMKSNAADHKGMIDPSRIGGLIEGLSSSRFRTRFLSAVSLEALADRERTSPAPPDVFFQAIRREVQLERKFWEIRLLSGKMEKLGYAPIVDSRLMERAAKSLDHVFRLLSLALPRHSLVLAYRCLESANSRTRGLAEEYLDGVLPPAVKKDLWPFLEDMPLEEERLKRPREEIMMDLLHANQSLEANLRDIKRILAEELKNDEGQADIDAPFSGRPSE